MSTNKEPNRIELDESKSDSQSEKLGRGFQLEKRHAPLVVIAIIAILIGLLVPAIQ